MSLNCVQSIWTKGDLVGIKSRTGQIVGLLQVERVDESQDQKKVDKPHDQMQNEPHDHLSEAKETGVESSTAVEAEAEPQQFYLRLISVREDRFLQSTDYLERLDLSSGTEELSGTSYLWKTRALPPNVKNLYRPLLTQGETIGETAQTLWTNEYFFNVFGTIGYGITDFTSASTNIPALLLGSPNGKIKNQVFRNVNQTWSVSLSMAQERNSSEKLFNIDVMWDSILSDTLVAHSLISVAVISFDSAKEVAALKSYGSSSIQTGYEYIFSDWSRFLIGPSYNIDQKALGGYLGYVKIINNIHLQASLTTNNIRELKLSAEEGYFFILDAYWRW